MTQSERAHPPLTRADLIWLQGWLNRAQQASDYDRWPLRRRAPFDDAARRQRLTVGFTHYGCWPDIPGQLDV